MVMKNSKIERRPRLKPTLQELNEINDKLLQDLVLLFKESISHVVQKNISIKDYYMSIFWNHICACFQKLRDLQESERKELKQVQIVEHKKSLIRSPNSIPYGF